MQIPIAITPLASACFHASKARTLRNGITPLVAIRSALAAQGSALRLRPNLRFASSARYAAHKDPKNLLTRLSTEATFPCTQPQICETSPQRTGPLWRSYFTGHVPQILPSLILFPEENITLDETAVAVDA